MSTETREIVSPVGPLGLRRAGPDDEAFQYALFASHRALVFAPAGLPGPALEMLLAQQFRAREQSYRARYPAARRFVVTRADERIGALIVDEAPDAAHIVDIALLPAWRAQGVGAALLCALMRDYASVSAMADVGNAASRRMFAGLGFAERLLEDGVNVGLAWRRQPLR